MSTTEEMGERSGEDPVLARLSGNVLTVTLNRPRKKNALDPDAWRLLREAFRGAASDDAVRAVVLTGAGGDFCAGADLTAMTDRQHPLRRMELVNSVAEAVFHLPKPVLARVRGACVGAGWNLALCCDVVAASENARFSQIFANRGLSPDFGGSWLLPRIVGMQQAKRLVMLGEFVGASEAADLGLVTWVREDDELDAFAASTAESLARKPPAAVAQAKDLLHTAAQQSFGEALGGEARAQAVNFATEDAANAREAFTSGTEPEFTGRWAAPDR
ncbi:enoyl-CoA hydratase/isomerase family protein [Salinifilum ghardaiensis]